MFVLTPSDNLILVSNNNDNNNIEKEILVWIEERLLSVVSSYLYENNTHILKNDQLNALTYTYFYFM
jgi:hypothetical protein